MSNCHEQNNLKSLCLESLKTVGLSLVFAFGIRAFVAEARYVSSASMVPSLEVNDRVIVDKLSYRFHNPQRGDIIVFSPPGKLRQNYAQDNFIKRVIGLPGEKVEIKEGRVYINNKLLRESYVRNPVYEQWGPVKVPPNSYLVLGDARNNSYDGRYWGFVPHHLILGQAVVRYWPFHRFGKLEQHPTPAPAN